MEVDTGVEWPDRATALLRSAERDLVAAAGDASLCALSRSGGRVDGVKYLEGRTAVLRAFLRALATTPGEQVHAEMTASWTAHLEQARERMGPDWVAYRSGGVDALADLVAVGSRADG
jgi:hypothetical protein